MEIPEPLTCYPWRKFPIPFVVGIWIFLEIHTFVWLQDQRTETQNKTLVKMRFIKQTVQKRLTRQTIDEETFLPHFQRNVKFNLTSFGNKYDGLLYWSLYCSYDEQ